MTGTATGPAASRGGTVWLTGLPSAGKTTIALALAARLRAEGRRVQVLDGDEIRASLSPELGFSAADRDTSVRRVGFLARLLAGHGVTVLAPVIAPYAASRAAVREEHRAHGVDYVEVHVATPATTCAARDVKGLWARRAAGTITGLTGADDPYEEPVRPELRLDTRDDPIDESVRRVRALLTARGL